jgi:spermidine synthase
VPTDRTVASFLRVFPYVVAIGKFALIGSAIPIDISYDRFNKELAGPAGEYLTKMGWNRDAVAALLISGLHRIWTPQDPREDRDVNTDIFPKDEYYRNSRKLDLIGDNRAGPSDLASDHPSASAR